jgi:hypothetical protein
MTSKNSDPLKILEVIDRLEIGPSIVKRNRLLTPYKVFQNGNSDFLNLIYKFEEDVFDISDSQSQNLADIIGAQVALNYGLFAKKIIFKGNFDIVDQKFLLNMAENTAREIYVKKFLEPNPFLLGKAANLPAIKKDKYLRSEIIFPNILPNRTRQKKGADSFAWLSESSRYAVLSSGGKDSLLSFGVINELGYETHPIYVNESGRHWYTALNAYRYFKKQYPQQTSRVWTNADRIFNWMLHHLPFIRQDFARFRADEYPIRLWTVAVFIFGALPILRKRGIGRMILGDEYDTTRKMKHLGLVHYDGLYDQSRYFDNALSRYYESKGWKVRQFSILRPLAEMLIEKILVERYPDLQRHQVSCHATHIEIKRVYPCGSCEKCRRIVGMLLALGADPKRCGYNKAQISSVLNELSNTNLRQDAASAEHLAYLLTKRGLISRAPGGTLKVRENPQVLKLMFDNEKSRVEEIPEDIRGGIIKIYLEHATGTAKRSGKRWIDIK